MSKVNVNRPVKKSDMVKRSDLCIKSCSVNAAKGKYQALPTALFHTTFKGPILSKLKLPGQVSKQVSPQESSHSLHKVAVIFNESL